MRLGKLRLLDARLAIDADSDVADVAEGAAQVFYMQRNVNWWVGDLINFGEARWGDEIWQVVPEGVSESMIGRCVAHCRKIKPTYRVPEATWTLHSVAAKYEPYLRKALLRHAVANNMNTDEFRDYLKRVAG